MKSNQKHKKLRNTGILFELLVKAITNDALNDRKSPAVDMIQKYFSNTELMKEYVLYQTLANTKNLSEGKSDILINSVLASYKKLDRKKINESKYNLVKDIRTHYDDKSFFKVNVADYKLNASIFTLLENSVSDKFTDPTSDFNVRNVIIEHITSQNSDNLAPEWKQLDRGMQNLTLKIMVENFNKNYSNFSPVQKSVISEYVKLVDSPSKMRLVLNKALFEVKQSLANEYNSITDTETKSNLKGVINGIQPFDKTVKIKESDVVSTLYYCELLNEIQNAK